MLTLVATLLAVAPADPVRVALPNLRLTDVPAERASFYTEHLATGLIQRGMRVITEREMGTLIGLERQKEMLGCSDTGCLVELASALGTDGVIIGDIAKVGAHFHGNLRAVNAKNGEPLAVTSFKVVDEEALVDELDKAAAKLAVEVPKALGRPVPLAALPPSASASSGGLPRRIWWVPAAAAVLAAGAGVACFVWSRNDYAALDPAGSGMLDGGQAQGIASRGKTLQATSIALWVTSGVLAVLAAGVGLFGTETRGAVALTPQGAALSIAGVWP